jgi:hypothetical protein
MTRKNISPLFIGLFICICFTGCVTSQRTDIFFGMSIPGGGEVSLDDWKQFNDSVVAPRFPAGYTEFTVAGRWLDSDTRQTISENTRVLTFVGNKSRERERLLDTIIQHYIRSYKQQAILRVDAKSTVKFISANSGNQ